MNKERAKNMKQRTRKLMMHQAQHPRDDIDSMW